MNRSELAVHDVVVSKVPEGHLLFVMTDTPADSMSLLFRGPKWTVQYAVARGARLASTRGGSLWYTDSMATFEYLETFRAAADAHLS